MAILDQQVMQRGSGGVTKQIEESAVELILDNLQKYQYQFPIKSTTRELLCNGMDSVAEKKMVIDILSGKSKPEDYFVEKDGKLYNDSKFDPSYYDLNWLDMENHRVIMRYQDGSMTRDTVTFSDNGVGIGAKRLEGYFRLGYSTKRLSKLPIGKFGIGAKAPLSTGVQFYTMESRYNGQLFRFNIYAHSFDSIIPAVDPETGRVNEFMTFNTGTEDEYKVYYEPTSAKNGVVVTLEAKKHHKQQFIDAVKSQMLYFPNITLFVVDTNGKSEVVEYKAKILYEDENIVMSEQEFFAKPHILLNGVNYGYVNWDEMELESRNGNIGIKVAPEDVEVNPSREAVIWSDLTKEKVLKRFRDVLETATRMIENELESTDLIKWLKTCYSLGGRFGGRSGVLGRLSQIVDMSTIKLKFNGDKDIMFHSANPLAGMSVKHVRIVKEIVNHVELGRKVLREPISYLGNQLNLPILLKKDDTRFGNRKDKYLHSLYPGGVLVIEEPYFTLEGLDLKRNTNSWTDKEYDDYKAIMALTSLGTKEKIWDLLKKADGVTWYEKVEVPEGFTGNEEEEERNAAAETATEEDKQTVAVARQSASERRKLEGKTIVHQLNPSAATISKQEPVVQGTTQGVSYKKIYEFQKTEIPFKDIDRWDAEEIYYGFEEDSELLVFTGLLTRDPFPWNNPVDGYKRGHASSQNQQGIYHSDLKKWTEMKWWRKNKGRFSGADLASEQWRIYALQHFYDTKVMLFKIAKTQERYYRQFSRIQEFYITIRDKVITMSNTLIKWNTARLLIQKISPLNFLYNFSAFSPEFTDKYHQLLKYVNQNFREVESYNSGARYNVSAGTYQDMISHLENVQKFQELVKGNTDKREISRVAMELFGNRELKDGMAVDPVIMQVLAECLDYAAVVGDMLNYIPALTGITSGRAESYSPGMTRNSIPELRISQELEADVRNYLSFKGADKVQQESEENLEIAPVEHEEKLPF